MQRIGRRRWYAIVAASLACAMSMPAQADVVVCTAKIDGVAITPDGSVFINWRGIGWPLMCNLNTTTATNSGPVSPTVCQGMLSQYITAKTSGQNYTMYIDYATATAPACNALANFSWQVPAVYPYHMSFEG